MRPASVLVVLGAVVLAGCAGSPGGEVMSPTTDGSSTPTDATTDPTPTAVAAPPDATAEKTVVYENLTDRQQEAFRDATDGVARFEPDSPYVNRTGPYTWDDAALFRGATYVRYEGAYYAVDLTNAGYRVAWRIRFVLRGATWEPDSPVAAFEDLSSRARSIVKVGVGNGSYYADYGEWGTDFPDSLERVDYVRYRDDLYELDVIRSENVAWTMTVQRVDGTATTSAG